jgi:hypothetical protein
MSVKMVTSLSSQGMLQYGEHCLESLAKIGLPMTIYEEIEDDAPIYGDFINNYENVNVENLYNYNLVVKTLLNMGNHKLSRGLIDKDDKTFYDYRFDAYKFCRKPFAIKAEFDRLSIGDYLVWIDADVYCHDAPDEKFFKNIIGPADIAYLGREKMHSECGFMIFFKNNKTSMFIDALVKFYSAGIYTTLPEYHDSFVFDFVRVLFPSLSYKNISGDIETMHPFINSALGKHFDHLKGPRRKEYKKSFKSDLAQQRNEDYWNE